MIEELHIKNYALIEDMKIRFTRGFNVLTGETGAGKSIVIEALGLLLGERPIASAVRHGSEQCTITGVFEAPQESIVHIFLSERDLAGDDETLIVRREITVNGKNRCYLNDHPVNVGTLVSIGELLVDVHGQHEHQKLLHTAEQRIMLDRFGELDTKTACFKQRYDEYQTLCAERETVSINEQEKNRRIDLYRFQWKEIEDAHLLTGEDEELEQKIPTLKHADKLTQLANRSYDILYSAEGSLQDQLSELKEKLNTIYQLSGRFKEAHETLDTMMYTLEDLTHSINDFKKEIDIDPKALDALLTRQDIIDALKRKYGSTIPEIRKFQERIKQELDHLEHLDDIKQETEKRLAEKKKMLMAFGRELSALRKKTAGIFAERIEKEVRMLGMPKAEFAVEVSQMNDERNEPKITAAGFDHIEYVLSPNPGQKLLPLKHIASGGELSRVMLAIKTVAAHHDQIPTLIFDEIDAGVGGSMASIIGEKLASLASLHHIIVITHMPHIAAYGQTHFKVWKESKQGHTRTYIERLSDEKRKEEIAAMLGGKEVSPVSLQHADHMLKNAR